MDEIAAKQAAGKPIEIWWQDEARIGQKNKITRRWAKRGTRPSAPHDQRTKSVYLFGAICPAQGKAAGLVLPFCNTAAMILHLEEISLIVSPGAHAVVLVDQAGWHLANDLIVPDNITLLPLPPKCPELNPVENIWQFMRDNWLSNRVFKSYARHPGPLRLCMEQTYRPTLDHYVNRSSRLGSWVVISGTWYNTSQSNLSSRARTHLALTTINFKRVVFVEIN